MLEKATHNINQIFLKEKLKKPPKKIAVAISGGSDSMALTLFLQEFCLKNKIELFAITINHKIRASSDKESLKLNNFLKKQKIPHQILEISWQEKPTSNLEAKMREARYELLYSYCAENKIKYLFLGHHLGDAAENFLIRLFRGSGLDGLCPILEISDFKKIKLVRPLLNFHKEELQSFLKANKIKWFEDESNEDEKFLRNKIRKFLDSFPEKNLIEKRINNSSEEIAKTRDLFDQMMLLEAKKAFTFQANKILINLENFKKINEKFALKILALNVAKLAKKPYKPRLEKLKKFYEWILNDIYHKPRDFYGCIAKKYDKFSLVILPQK